MLVVAKWARSGLFITLLGLVSCTGGDSAEPHPTRHDCEQVVVHLADLDVAAQSAHSSPGDAAINEAHRKQLTAALLSDERTLSHCETKYSPAEVACFLAAKTTSAARACLPN